MDFGVLGPVELRVGGRPPADLGPGKQRSVLAALLIDTGRVVRSETLIDRVWGDSPPAQVRNVVYTYVSRIRRLLGGVGVDATVVRLCRRSGGYLLEIEPEHVDLHRFRRLVADARAARDADEAAAVYRRALGLWRGDACADLSGVWFDLTREALDGERMAALADCLDAELVLGRHAKLLPELSALRAAHPLDERLAGQTMLAAYRGRGQAEALSCYEQIRRRLADELGVDPGLDLQQLYLRMLHADPALSALSQVAVQPEGVRVETRRVPAQLPHDAAGFTGRTAHLKELDALLDSEATAVVISAIAGTAGVGKTALAVHWAHLVADRFPDGQFYVNLRGFDPSASPTTPGDAVRGFLDALDIPAQRVPVDVAAQAALYRSLLAGRRVLVVLDNARDAEQVRPLLPGTSGCLVVVTSRNQLPGLVAADGAHPLVLDLLTPAEARQLLARRLGHNRVDAEPQAVEAIITACARLPLALTIVAARAATHPQFSLAALCDELRQARGGLDAFTGAEPSTDIRAVFSWSYHALSTGAARLFRLLGLHPGPDFATPAAASLASIPITETPPLLAELTCAHLIEEHAPGRYTFHDLLRAYATEQAHTHDIDTDRRAALTRLFDFYLATAAAAVDTLHPAEVHHRPRIPPPGAPVPALVDSDTAGAWLDTERPTLVAVAAHTATRGWPTHATRLSATLFRYLARGFHTDGLAVHGNGLHAARQTGDLAAQAHALIDLGTAHMWLGQYGPAADRFQKALHLLRQTGDPAGQARALDSLGAIEDRLGRSRDAADHIEQALALYRQADDRTGEATVLTSLGMVEYRLGRYQQSVDHQEQALALYREAGDRTGEAGALNYLGYVEARLGRSRPAADHLYQALVLFRQAGHRSGQAWTLDSLGILHTHLGQPAQAAECYREALTIFRENDQREGETWALNGLGEAAHAAGRPTDALTHHTAALTIAVDIGDRHQQARAHTGLAHAHHGLGDPAHAREHYQHALALYTDLGMPQADQIHTHLATIDDNSSKLR